jgi:hypothetical protein
VRFRHKLRDPTNNRSGTAPWTEHFYVAAPAVEAGKARPGFEQWWPDATAPARMF